MPGPSPFGGDWRDCLSAHYTHTVRMNDVRTERTLVEVLHSVGFTDSQLAEIRVLATLDAGDLPEGVVADAVADMEAALRADAPVFPGVDVPDDAARDSDQPAEAGELEDAALMPEDEPPVDAALPPTQLSFF